MNTRSFSSADARDKVTERLVEIRKHGQLRREADVGAIDKEARTVELSFSSEVEYSRWFGIEILGHDAGEIRLDRLTNKAPVLWMHDWNDQRGVVESVRIDGDRKGRALVRFSKSPAGDQLFQDICDSIVTKVSVGYMVHGLKLTEEREDVDVYRVTDWEPFEISMVSVPADDTVGVGRAMEKPQEEPAAISAEYNPANHLPEARTVTTMEEKIVRNAKGDLVRALLNEDGTIAREIEVIERAGAEAAAALTRGQDAERARVRAINDMGVQYARTDLALKFISEGKTPEDFQRELLHSYATERGNKPLAEQQRDVNLGLSGKEVRQYSIMKAIRAMTDPNDKAAQEAARFELECSRAAAEQYGKQPKGVIIRAFGSGSSASNSGGGAAIATNLLAGSFIDILRKKAWVMSRARTLTGLVGNVDIPKQTSSTQAYWVGEGGAPTAGQPGLDQISFTPKTVGAYTDITRRLLKQATPDAEAIVRDDILKVMALELDRVTIYGSGGEFQPKGLRNYSGINAQAFGTAGAPSYAELVNMETKIALSNADVDGMSYAFNAGIRGGLKTTLKFPAVNGSQPIWEPGNTVNGYATDVSNQIASGDVFFGNWLDMVIAMWGGLELTVDPYALSTSGGIRIIALQDIDVNLRRIESFCCGA
jgi:HK97 family phage major capsid protein/HK97 family phage prohead protease